MTVGRPTVMTEVTIGKLESAFAKGCTILEACFLAEISKDSYYDYLKLKPEFSERVEMLRDNVALQARMNLAASIGSGDVNDSKWYLERKKRDEFGAKQDINLGGQSDNPLTLIQRTIVDPAQPTNS